MKLNKNAFEKTPLLFFQIDFYLKLYIGLLLVRLKIKQ